MDYSKPKVTIDLDEYLHLTHKPIVPGTELNEIEYGAALLSLVNTALQSPILFRGKNPEGINLNTRVGKFKAFVEVTNVNATDLHTTDSRVGIVRIVKSE